jgi:hypothetical protein
VKKASQSLVESLLLPDARDVVTPGHPQHPNRGKRLQLLSHVSVELPTLLVAITGNDDAFNVGQ